MGYGTPPRPGLGFTRTCARKPFDDLDFGFLPGSCPGDDFVAEYTRNGTEVGVSWNGTYDVRIPRSKAIFLQSGLDEQPASVSNFFDIEWRQSSFTSEGGYNNNESYVVGAYRPLASLLLAGGVQVVEGLVVDFADDSVGFRNHTAPVEVQTGAPWQEDLLFIEPITTCADMNLTLDYTLPDWTETGAQNLALTDRGGFSNFNTTFPGFVGADTQRDPQLDFRAHKSALDWTLYTMLHFNISAPGNGTQQSHMGKRFPLSSDSGAIFLDSNNLLSFSLSSLGSRLGLESDVFDDTSWDIETLCIGAGGADIANMSTAGAVCGVLLGAPERQDDKSPFVSEPGSPWSRRIYTCASAPQALIKTVQLSWNSSKTGLGRIQAHGIKEKYYDSDLDKPWWAVEDPKMTWAEVSRILWGLVSASNVEADASGDYQYVQSHRLMLPAWSVLGLGTGEYGAVSTDSMNIPAAHFATEALYGAYEISQGTIYSGDLSLALSRRWQGMSTSASGAANIINLISTDIAANAVVGTRSWLPSPRLPPNLQEVPAAQSHSKRDLSTSAPQGGSNHGTRAYVPVHVIRRRVAFDWRYGIPTLLVLCLFATIMGATVLAAVCGRVGPNRLRWYLNNLSAGRLLTKHLQTEEGEAATLSTKRWVRSYGTLEVDLGPIIKEKREAYAQPVYSPIKPEEVNSSSQSEMDADQARSRSVARS